MTSISRAAKLAVAALLIAPLPVSAQLTNEQIKAATDFREEQLARSIGTLAYIYAYPAVDYYRVMYEQTTPGIDKTGAYAPINRVYTVNKLTEPGGPYAGRAPNDDTMYFHIWFDVSGGPVIINAPDMKGRYYNLDFVNFKSETEAHTGRRTTGTQSQTVYLVGPRWKGEQPKGSHLVRMSTDQGIVVGRVLVTSSKDAGDVRKLISQFEVTESPGTPTPAALKPVAADTLSNIEFFTLANQYLRGQFPVTGEEALMDQFDRIGIGPKSQFDVSRLRPATRRGLELAIADGKKMVQQARFLSFRGWSSVHTKIGVYGTDYLQRAAIEYSGLLANAPEEAVYPRYNTDPDGNLLDGRNRYRIVVPANMPIDAFWSLTPYSYETRDLIPNPQRIYSMGSRDPKKLKRQPDGSAVVAIQADPPSEKNVNWLPVHKEPFYLIMRLYQPRPEVFEDGFALPEIQKLP